MASHSAASQLGGRVVLQQFKNGEVSCVAMVVWALSVVTLPPDPHLKSERSRFWTGDWPTRDRQTAKNERCDARTMVMP
jgi:hypothetical protein